MQTDEREGVMTVEGRGTGQRTPWKCVKRGAGMVLRVVMNTKTFISLDKLHF